MKSNYCCLLLAVASFVLAGCSSNPSEPRQGPTVTGKLTVNGQPLKDPGSEGLLRIQLWPADAAPDTLVDPQDASYDYGDGAFSVGGTSGSGVTPGKYRIAIEYWEHYDPDAPDKFNNAYDRANTTIVREVKADGSQLDLIDLK